MLLRMRCSRITSMMTSFPSSPFSSFSTMMAVSFNFPDKSLIPLDQTQTEYKKTETGKEGVTDALTEVSEI